MKPKLCSCLLLMSLARTASAGGFTGRLPMRVAPGQSVLDYPVTVPVGLKAAYKAIVQTDEAPARFEIQLRHQETGRVCESQYLPAIEGVCGETVSFYAPAGKSPRDYWLYFRPDDAEQEALEDELAGRTKKDLLTGIPMGSLMVNLTEGWNLRAGSSVSGAAGGIVFNIYRVTPAGRKEMSPHFTFEKLAEGPVVAAFVMRAKSGYEDTFVWYVYKRGGYRICRLGGQDATRMYWIATVGKARYFLFSHSRFPIDIKAGGSPSGSGRFLLASMGEDANLLLCADKRFHCSITPRVLMHGSWREMFVRYRTRPFDETAREGDAIVDWIDHLSERTTFGKAEKTGG